MTKWYIKKKPILEKINSAIQSYENIRDGLDYVRGEATENTEKVSDDLVRLYQLRSIYENEETNLRLNPFNESSIDTMMYLTVSNAENASRMVHDFSEMTDKMDSFTATINASGLTSVKPMMSITYNLAEQMENKEVINQYINAIKNPSPRDRKIEL